MKLFDRLRTNASIFREIIWLLIPAVLLIILPVFLWAVLTQRIELRKKAASYPPPSSNPTIWMTDNVSLTADSFYIYTNGQYFWGNTGDVRINSDPGNPNYTTLEVTWHENLYNGTPVEMKMNIYFRSDGKNWWVDEITTYNGAVPGEWIFFKGKFFTSPVGQHYTGTVDLTSTTQDSDTNAGRIHFGNMKLLPFIKYMNQQCWNLVGGSGDNLYWRDGCRGRIVPGQMCTQAITPLTSEEIRQYQSWVSAGRPPIPGCTVGTPTPTCRPRPACLDSIPRCLMPETADMCPPVSPAPTPKPDNQCVGQPNGTNCTQEICEVTMGDFSNDPVCHDMPGVCKNGQCVIATVTGYPVQTPTPTPRTPVSCARGTPQVTVDKPVQAADAGKTLTYRYTIKNTDTAGCGPTTFMFTTEVPSGWSSFVQTSAGISPGQTITVPILVTSATDAAPNSYTVNLVMTGAASYHYMRIPVTYTIPNQVQFDQTFEFKFKFAGVAGGNADGAHVQVHIVTPARHLVTPQLTATHIGNGVYRVSFVTASPLAAGDQVYFLIKGEKHAAMKFCSQVGQTTPCQASQWVTVPDPVPLTWGFDFTGMPLLAGDVSPQDNITNTADYARIRALLKKPTTQLTEQDKLVGDLNYDGYVDVRDILLIQQTLESHFDPS